MAGQVCKGMIASGLKTAAPQVISEAVLVTNSACFSSLEAPQKSPIVPFLSQFASVSDAIWTQPAPGFGLRLHPSVDSASRFRTLSVPVVSGA
jgi:hypothetical protein